MTNTLLTKILQNKHGSTLLLTVLLLTAIFIAAMNAASLSLTGLSIGGVQQRSSLAFYSAESGEERALFDVRKNGTTFSSPGINIYGTTTLSNNSYYKVDYATSSSVITISSNGAFADVVSPVAITMSITQPDILAYFGDIYPIVQIGSQRWMAQNLRTTKYPDGSNITKGPVGDEAAGWGNSATAYYSCPPNTDVYNPNEDCAAVGGSAKLGMLYQWKTAMNGSSAEGAQGICPNGWHIPSDQDWKILEMTLGMSQADADLFSDSAIERGTDQGTQLKVGGTSGFDGVLAGWRYTDGGYEARGSYGEFWSSTLLFPGACDRTLSQTVYDSYDDANILRSIPNKAIGLSVRCLQN